MVDTTNTDPLDSQRSRAAGREAGHVTRTVFSLSEDETLGLGRSLAQSLRGGELILLEGELGMGKTVFVRGVAAGLGISPEDVNSPSFTLVQEYCGGRLAVFHVDLYRLDSVEEVSSLGLEEIVSSGSVTLVEWGEKLTTYHRTHAVIVRFHDVGEGSRRIELVLPDPDGTQRRGDA